MMLDTDPDTSVLALILDENPTLSWRGWWSRWHENNEPLGTLERVRRESLDIHGLGQFRRAMAFLAVAPRRKSVNRGTRRFSEASRRIVDAKNQR